MTLSPSPSTENHCSGSASLSENKDISYENANEEDEDGDMDFNPFLKEASSSLSSEIEEFDPDFVDSIEIHSPVVNFANAEPNIATDTVITDDVIVDSDGDEDAIWRRTRARYSLVGSTLDELETFLQETDDEDELHCNIDDEDEYRKFLAAVLNNASSGAPQESDNLDEEDEDNDADFELELEEALESDVEENENLHNMDQEWELKRVGRRPETRQKPRQKTDVRQKGYAGHTNKNRPLRPILPYAPVFPNTYNTSSSSANNNHICAFTPYQIGQLYCLMYEHVQLLVQLFSVSILEPSKQHIATQVHKLLTEMLHTRDQVLASQRVPIPGFCFSLPYTCSAVTSQNTAIPVDGSFWVPFVGDTVLSVMDVAPLNVVQSYLDDVSISVQEHQQRRLEATYDGTGDRVCLFPSSGFHSSDGVSSDPTAASSDQKSKKTVALVPKDIAELALRFFPLFNPALFPHKPPPSSVANRVLFTDSEDGLLARGLMRYNTDWKEIQKNFLPCKTPHQAIS